MEATTTRYIIARYQEDLSWLSPLLQEACVVNKGPPLNLSPLEVVERHNVGRESDSYLHFIIQHYDHLPDVCVFTQGDISDHVTDAADPVQYLQRLAQEALELGMSRPRASCSNPYDKDWGPAWNVRNNKYYLENNYKDDQHIVFYEWFLRNICDRYPKLMRIHMNGIFAVRKDRILAQPKHVYMRLLSQLNWHVDPVEGHFMERSWFFVFDTNNFQHNKLACISPSIVQKAYEEKGLEFIN